MKKIGLKALKGATLAGAALGIQMVANRYLSANVGPLDSVLPGPTENYNWRLGKIAYHVRGDGPPVLLLHGIGAGASSYEWRKNFETLSEQYRVYALDLLGFGGSEHPLIHHSGRLYVQLVDDFVAHVIKRSVNVIASSHSAAYAIRLASTRPDRIHSLLLICPIGLSEKSTENPGMETAARVLSIPVLGDTAYNALVSKSNIARTLREDLYYDPGLVTEPMIDHYYTTSHQPGAKTAIASFLAGNLDLNVEKEFKSIHQPVMIVWGSESKYTPVASAHLFQEARPEVALVIQEHTRQIPQDEKSEEFNRLALTWIGSNTTDQAIHIL